MRWFKYVLVFLLAAAVAAYWQKKAGDDVVVLYGQTMGTYYNIKVKTVNKDKMLGKQVKEELEFINAHMSVFDPLSEISKINHEKAGVWVDLSKDLSAVLKKAYEIYQMSGGYFDPTVGKLVDVWGFGVSQQKKYPSKEEIASVLAYSGFDKIEFSADFSKLRKKDTRTYLNLSALAKGYGVDRVYNLLKDLGYKNFVVEIGGEVRTFGLKTDDGASWKIGVVEPGTDRNEYVVELKDSSVATSGDYRNFYYLEGKRLSHTISPKTGYPVEHNLTSATVFDQSCMTADALATAFMAMGETKALDFANKNNLAVILFIKDHSGKISHIISKPAQKILEKK